MKYDKVQQYSSYETTPRQRRLAAQRQFLLARYHEAFSTLGGILVLILLVICLCFL